MDERFEKVESKVAFQEHMIDQLNAVVARQQTALDVLEQRVERLEAQARTSDGGE